MRLMDEREPLRVPALPPGAATGAPVAVALSGGLDSTVLLHLLAGDPLIRARGLRALHVHHGLHADADDWAARCVAACDALALRCDVIRVEVARHSGLGLEGAAREARHAALSDTLRTGEVLAVAHHRDDQAETFLLRALRASGPEGLAAMRPWRPFGRGWMWRPLLAYPRARLEAWARACDLAWIEDPANADPAHDRTHLRHLVLPLLRERWPSADAALARSAAMCAEAADLLAAHDADALHAVLSGAHDAAAAAPPPRNSIPVESMRALLPPERARVLRAWVAGLSLPPLPASAIDAIERLLDARPDGDAQYRWSDGLIRTWRGHLYAMPLPSPLPADWSLEWDGRQALALPAGGSLALEGAVAFDRPLRVHARRGGERLRLPGRSHSHALKHLLQDGGVPPWQRARMPLLSDPEGELLAAGDQLLSAPLHAWLRERGARLRWRDMA
jgi:tRNA(Ile)-lysidine synthase